MGNFMPGMPARTNRSRWLRAQARTRTRIWLALMRGSGMSSYHQDFRPAMLVNPGGFHLLKTITAAAHPAYSARPKTKTCDPTSMATYCLLSNM